MISIINLILILFGLFLLFKGADLLLKSSIYIAEKTGVPKFIVGVTIVAIGTSIPELIINVISTYQNNTDLVVGNVIGSNISNVLLVIGIAAIITPIRVKKLVATRDIPFSLASLFVFSLLALDMFFGNSNEANILSTSDGLILLLFFAIFIYYVAFSHREHHEEIKSYSVQEKIEVKILVGIFGLILLIIGGALVVENAVIIAQNIGIEERIIGLTIISIGTSLPELVTILVSVINKETDIGVGNIIGSNIVNLLFILGMNVVISPIEVPDGIGIDILVLLIGTFLLLASLFLGKRNKVDRAEGFFFVVIYVIYLLTLFR